jgi:hypothetical protein
MENNQVRQVFKVPAYPLRNFRRSEDGGPARRCQQKSLPVSVRDRVSRYGGGSSGAPGPTRSGAPGPVPVVTLPAGYFLDRRGQGPPRRGQFRVILKGLTGVVRPEVVGDPPGAL